MSFKTDETFEEATIDDNNSTESISDDQTDDTVDDDAPTSYERELNDIIIFAKEELRVLRQKRAREETQMDLEDADGYFKPKIPNIIDLTKTNDNIPKYLDVDKHFEDKENKYPPRRSSFRTPRAYVTNKQ